MDDDVDSRIAAVFAGEAPWAMLPALAERKRTVLFSLAHALGAGEALTRLWWHPALVQDIARPAPYLAHLGVRAGNTLPDALFQLARRHEGWKRAPESWTGGSLSSLARHLFVDTPWPPPALLDEAWLRGQGASEDGWREAFVRIGARQGVQKIALGSPLTEKGRHYFLLAPPERFSALVHAVRYGQVLSFGGTERVASAICATRLGELLSEEPFWESVIHFFVRSPQLPLSQIGPVVDFLWHQREIEPSLSMKGRTPEALLFRVSEWHAALARLPKSATRRWKPLSLPSFTRIEDAPGNVTLTWNMVELTDTYALQQEGSDLRHCVRSYDAECLKGKKAVFSLRLHASDSRATRRMLTIEVDPHRRSIVQVRGRANCLPKNHRPESRVRRAGALVREWARERNLGISATF
jgi:PcfJ-like protein